MFWIGNWARWKLINQNCWLLVQLIRYYRPNLFCQPKGLHSHKDVSEFMMDTLDRRDCSISPNSRHLSVPQNLGVGWGNNSLSLQAWNIASSLGEWKVSLSWVMSWESASALLLRLLTASLKGWDAACSSPLVPNRYEQVLKNYLPDYHCRSDCELCIQVAELP